MKHIIREPLLHFLLLGAAMFAAFHWLSRLEAPEPGRVVVTHDKIQHLATMFTRLWQRPPTEGELDGLIQDYVQEEVYAREALALGLDRDDAIIRRRLRQKLEFVSEDVVAQAEPTDEELRTWLEAHPAAFRVEPRLTFSQVYLNPQRRGQHLARDAVQLLAQLRLSGGQADVATLGDAFLLGHSFEALPIGEVQKQLGEPFTAALSALEPGQWQGPIASGYGLHLVFVHERAEGRLPALEEVRDAVHRAWTNARRLEAQERFYQALLQRYSVTIEKPQLTDDEKNTVEVRR
jgi:hypothetical protein